MSRLDLETGESHTEVYDGFAERSFTIKGARITDILGEEIPPVDSTFEISTMVTYYDTGLLTLYAALHMPDEHHPGISVNLGEGTHVKLSAKRLLKIEQYFEEKAITEKTPENLKKMADEFACESTDRVTSMGLVSYEKAGDFRKVIYSKVNETIEELGLSLQRKLDTFCLQNVNYAGIR